MLLGVLLGVMVLVGVRTLVKVRDAVLDIDDVVEGDTLSEIVSERDVDEELEDDAEVVVVIDHEDDGLGLTVVDTVAELLLDSDVLSDRVGDTLLITVEEMDDVVVAEGDPVAL